MMFDQRKAGGLHREGMHLTQVNSGPTASSGRAYRVPGQPGPKALRKRYESLAKAPRKATRRRRQPTVSTPAARKVATAPLASGTALLAVSHWPLCLPEVYRGA
jgi:hypothetical protein